MALSNEIVALKRHPAPYFHTKSSKHRDPRPSCPCRLVHLVLSRVFLVFLSLKQPHAYNFSNRMPFRRRMVPKALKWDDLR